MNIEQIYTGCLSHAAYYIESNGEVAIVDPLREVQPYLNRAKADNAKIKYVFETHFHADFVSGHLDLKEKTGADIVFGPTAKPSYEAIIATDGQIFEVGDYKLKLLHTPGHTMESMTLLLIDENGKEHGIITGDTLFIGDVGRPDLAQHIVSELTEEILAGHLFDSLRNKIMPLSDDLIVYPNHGAGSACGKNMSSETTDTLGNQKKTNYALRPDMTKEEFVKELLHGLAPPPGYFPQNVLLNINGYQSLDNIKLDAYKGYSVDEFSDYANKMDAIILDVRHQDDFAKGHIPNSIFIGIDGGFAPWVGAIFKNVNQPILLVVNKDRLEETVNRLARVGFDNTLGYLIGGFDAWKEGGREIETVEPISAEELHQLMGKNENLPVFDVRKESEYLSEHIVGAENVPLSLINDFLDRFPKEEKFYIHCAGGYRSMSACSILKRNGIANMVDVSSGFNSIKESNIPISKYACPSTL